MKLVTLFEDTDYTLEHLAGDSWINPKSLEPGQIYTGTIDRSASAKIVDGRTVYYNRPHQIILFKHVKLTKPRLGSKTNNRYIVAEIEGVGTKRISKRFLKNIQKYRKLDRMKQAIDNWHDKKICDNNILAILKLWNNEKKNSLYYDQNVTLDSLDEQSKKKLLEVAKTCGDVVFKYCEQLSEDYRSGPSVYPTDAMNRAQSFKGPSDLKPEADAPQKYKNQLKK